MLDRMSKEAERLLRNAQNLQVLSRSQLEDLLAEYEVSLLDKWRIRLVWAGCYWNCPYISVDAEANYPLIHKDGSFFFGDAYPFLTFDSRFLRLWAEILDTHCLGLSPYAVSRKSLRDTHSNYAR